MKTLNIPKLRQERLALKAVTALAWTAAVVSMIFYFTNFGIAPDYAPQQYITAMDNLHTLMILAPPIFAVFGSLGLYFLCKEAKQ